MNKKKTVITTEKKEVWVIRNAPDAEEVPAPDLEQDLLPPAVEQPTDESPESEHK